MLCKCCGRLFGVEFIDGSKVFITNQEDVCGKCGYWWWWEFSVGSVLDRVCELAEKLSRS